MQTTVPCRGGQRRRVHLDSIGIFNLITDDRFFETLEANLPAHRERRYPPAQTLAMFVSQALSDDRSCRRAVDDHVARCVAHGLSAPSSSTGAYCDARQRLPIELIEALRHEVARATAQVDTSMESTMRTVLVDGTGFSMPDTPANQRVFPQSASQSEGCGFPQGRLVAMVCARTGSILQMRTKPAKGKGTGETSALREMIATLEPDTLLIGDAIYEDYFAWAMLARQNCMAIFEIHGSRALPTDLPRLLQLERPRRPSWMSPEEYATMPRSQRLRLVVAPRKNCRDKYLVTSMLDDERYPDALVLEQFARRWDIETDFRSFKCDLGSGVLSCRTPDMVRKELEVHALGYNLIRLLMCEAAVAADIEPRRISFRHAQQCWSAWVQHDAPLDPANWNLLLRRIAQHRVRGRPGRKEPRAVKRRPKRTVWLDLPRPLARTVCSAYEKTGR